MTDLDKITNFLTDLGFTLARSLRRRKSFLPGVCVEGMTLHISYPDLLWPGDILHEAGHVAVVPSMFRPHLTADVEQSLSPHARKYMRTHPFHIDENFTEDPIYRGLLQVGEAEAMAWSYAAAIACDVSPTAVFHSGAYDEDGASIIEMVSANRHFGINGLQAAKMTTVRTFPTMKRWLQV